MAHTAGNLWEHRCLASAMYLVCVGGVESEVPKALFGTVSFKVRDNSSPLLPSISIYQTRHCFVYLEKTIHTDRLHQLLVWLIWQVAGDGSPGVSLQSTTVLTAIAPIGTSSSATL